MGLNILYLQYANPWNPFSPGGIGIANHNVFKHLAKTHRIEVLTGYLPRRASRFVLEGVVYRHSVSSGFRILDRLLFSLDASTCRLRSYDLVVIPWDRYAPVKLRRSAAPVILELHASYSDIPTKIGVAEPLALYLLVRALRRVDYLCTVSQTIMDAESMRGYHFRQTRVIHNGIEEGVLIPADNGEDGRYFLFMGRLDIQTKGIDILLLAYRAAGAKTPLLIAGDGKDRNKVHKMIRELNLDGRVRLLGWVEGTHKRKLIAECMAVCIPSRSEGFPLIALEAMAMAKPVLGSTVGGLKEIVEHRISGLLCDRESVEQYAHALSLIADDPGFRARLAAGARIRGQQFTLMATVSRKEQFFHDVLEDFKRGSSST